MNSRDLVKQKQAVLYERREAGARRKRIFFIIIFLLLVVSFFYVIRKPFLRVRSVSVVGNGLVDNTEVQKFVENKISGYKYFLIPRNSILFIKKDILQKEIVKNFPRLSSAVVHTGNNLKIEIGEPVFQTMYCPLDGSNKPSISCALLHSNGVAGSIAPKYPYMPLFTFFSSGGAVPILGQQIIDPTEIVRITKLGDEISSYGMPVYGFVYANGYDEILLDTGDEFANLPRIRVLNGATDKDIHLTLGIALEDPIVKKLLLDNLNSLAYVDLRFDGQVVYKKKGEI